MSTDAYPGWNAQETAVGLRLEREGVVLWRGDCLEVLPTLPDSCCDAVITDPPYSSGGMVRGDRTQGTAAKYQCNTSALQAEKSSLFPAKTLATQPELF